MPPIQGVVPPGINVLEWLAKKGVAPRSRWTEPFGETASPPYDPVTIESLTRTAGHALPWFPAQMGDMDYYDTPEYREAQDAPYLAKLGRVAGFGLAMRGGVGKLPSLQRAEGTPKVTVTQDMLKAAQAGDEAARAQVMEGVQGMVASVANRHMRAGRPTAEFEDLLQVGNQVALKVLARQGETPSLAYIRGAVENEILKFQRQQGFRAKMSAPLEAAEGSMEDVAARIKDVPRSTLDQQLTEALGQLTDKQRDVVSLYLGLGGRTPMQVKDIAAIPNIGISQQMVSKHLASGLEKLKKSVQRLGLEPSDLVPETQMPPTSRRIKVKPVEGVEPPRSISGGSFAKAVYYGFQPGYKDVPGFHMYNLTEDIVGTGGKVMHPKGSTVSAETLRQYGVPFDPPPISGGSAPELSRLGLGLANRVPTMERAGGAQAPPEFRGAVYGEGPTTPYEPSWPSSAAATADAADSMNLGSVPGSRALDLQNDPEAVKRFLEMLDQYYGGQM